MIEILDEAHYIEFVGFPQSRGWNTTTHLALIDFGDGRPCRAYVKLPMMDAYPAVANEALGWMLTRALGLRAPRRVAIMVMSAEEYFDLIGPLPSYAEGKDFVLLWCSEELQFKSLRFLFHSEDEQDKALRALLKSKDGKRIAAMACFTGHIDTNPGNLLKVSASEYVSIDHEHLFMASDWRRGPPNPCADTHLLQWLTEQVKRGRVTPGAMRNISSEVALYGEAHSHAMGKIHPYALALLSDLTDEDAASRVLLFLVDRCWQSWLYRQLGILQL